MVKRFLNTLLLVALSLAATVVMPLHGLAQETNHISIDASQPVGPLETGSIQMGTAVSPSGEAIGINSRYLTKSGKPWVPVMGEFHFVRYPRKYWEEEILKMKAGGVQVVATYIVWIYHEEVEGQFDWSGQRDLRTFVQLCQKHGLYVFARIGPWAHAETRNGGFPDWVLKGDEPRSNDSVYLSRVQKLYGQIADQLHGLLWKDGGPIIGIQLENEYSARGPGRGDEHILQLKKMAVDLGLDVPLYTVTGWDGAAIPGHAVVPVFGGYPDAPWDASQSVLPPNEVYLFRFKDRAGGDMGAQGPTAHTSTSQKVLSRYPFLAAEYGGGLEVTYHRRPVIKPDDLAAMLPVQLGSGVNLFGYYMFQGGANLMGRFTSLQESQASGSATDVPVLSYDFQAPLSEYGVERESFRRLKTFNYFLNDFGNLLAPTVTRTPSVIPSGPADFHVPRVSARTDGDSGFLFVNNYVRNYQMPARAGFQITLTLPHEAVSIPTAPITVPSGAYFIWPVNMDLEGARLQYATAQLLTKAEIGADCYYFFSTTAGIAAEFSFDAKSVRSISVSQGAAEGVGSTLHLRKVIPSTGVAFSFERNHGGFVRVIVLGPEDAGNLWRAKWHGHDQVVITSSDVFFSDDAIHLRSRGESAFDFRALPGLDAGTAGLRQLSPDGVFARYTAHQPEQNVKVDWRITRPAKPVPPVKLGNVLPWRKQAIAQAPDESYFGAAAQWSVRVHDHKLRGVSDVYLLIDYAGDVARLRAGSRLLDDNFFDGKAWTVGLKRFEAVVAGGPLTLELLPLRSDAPIYIPEPFRPKLEPGHQIDEVKSVRLIPEYELLIDATRNPVVK